MRARLPLLLVPICIACGATSDGQIGEQGLVRFSLVVDFAENGAIDSAIATKRTVFVAMQHPKTGFVDDETYTNLHLEVRNAKDEIVTATFPLGFAQYGVVFDEAGTYRMIAMNESEPLDEISIDVEDLADIDLARKVVVTTTYEDGNRRNCLEQEEILGIENVVLHENQSLEMFVLPKAAAGTNLIGLLALTGAGPESVVLHAPLVGQGRNANSLIVRPTSTMTPTIELSIRDRQADVAIDVPIATKNEPFVLDCSR